MIRARWRTGVGTVGIVMATAALCLLSALPPLAGHLTGITRTRAAGALCPAAPRRALADAARAAQAPTSVVRRAERLSSRGQFQGREVSIVTARGALDLSLPVESSVSDPVGSAVVYTTSAGGRSDVRVVDLSSGCDHVLARPAGVARSAVIAPDGSAVYVHSVAANDRADLGITRYALDDVSGPLVVVPPLPEDARFGRTFGTTLGFASDGASLAVQSCGFDACRTRLLDVASSAIETYDDPPHGALIGVTEGALVTYAACRGLPCAVQSISRSGRDTRTLAAEAWSASLVASDDGTTRVSIHTAGGVMEVEQ